MAITLSPIQSYEMATPPADPQSQPQYSRREFQKISITLANLKKAIEELKAAVESYHP